MSSPMDTTETKTTFQLDSIVANVIAKYIGRAEFGKQKYGTTLDRTDLNQLDWIKHTQEELMDAVLYLEKLSQTIQASKQKPMDMLNYKENI